MPPIINSQRMYRHLTCRVHELIVQTPRLFLARPKTSLSIPLLPTRPSCKLQSALDSPQVQAQLTGSDIVINMVATMFAEYCAVPFQIEPVRVHMPDGSSHLSPPLDARPTTASSSYINSSSGLALSREEQCGLLTRMSLSARPSPTDQDVLDVSVPPTRPDILHECDIMEDAAIAYGFNNLPKSMPTTNTVAKAHPVNKLSDVIRKECAMAGWTEALPLILVSCRPCSCVVVNAD